MVSRDGKTMILTILFQFKTGFAGLYVSYFRDGVWTEAMPINGVNTWEFEYTPVLSPDGKYLFFARLGLTTSSIYQIDLSATGINLFSEEGI
jgi:hypothetical protein